MRMQGYDRRVAEYFFYIIPKYIFFLLSSKNYLRRIEPLSCARARSRRRVAGLDGAPVLVVAGASRTLRRPRFVGPVERIPFPLVVQCARRAVLRPRCRRIFASHAF
jgi:hypothetical protein